MNEHNNLLPENDFLALPNLSLDVSDEAQREGSNSLGGMGPLYDLLDDEDCRGALSQADCSLPTGHETPSDETDDNRSHCGSDDAVAEEPPEEFDLIDFDYQYGLSMAQVPDEILLTEEQQRRVNIDLERAADGADLSDRLTGDSSGGSHEKNKEFETSIRRPSALRIDDRCITPTRSRPAVLARSPSSPNSQRTDWTQRSEVFHFTYETVNPLPQSPVPPYVFVHEGGLARVTVTPTGHAVYTEEVGIPETVPNQRDRRRQSDSLLSQICFYTILAILFLALVTLGSGLAKARELNRETGDGPQWLTPIVTPAPENTNYPSLLPTTMEPTPTPELVIPVEGIGPTDGALPPSLLKEGETVKPEGDPPTRPPRAPRTRSPTVAPSESSYPSQMPSTASQEYAMRHIQAIISYASPQSIPDLLDPTETSPQSKALQWLASEDMVLDKYSNDKIIQRWVLAAFHYSTTSVNSSWSDSAGWLEYTDECTWYSGDRRGMCNDEGDVRILDLQHNGLVGTLLPEISLLSNTLSTWNVSCCQTRPVLHDHLTDPISLFSKRMNTGRLYLRGNDVGGSLPTELGKLLNLGKINLFDPALKNVRPSQSLYLLINFLLITTKSISNLRTIIFMGAFQAKSDRSTIWVSLCYVHEHVEIVASAKNRLPL